MDQYYFKDHVLANTQSPIQYIKTNKRYVLHLCTAILYSWRLMKYCGGHNLPTNNVNTVTLFLMYRVIRISCLLRAILAELRSGATEEASIALNKQEIRITRYIRKRVTVLTLYQENYGHHNISLASKSTVLQYINSIHISCFLV